MKPSILQSNEKTMSTAKVLPSRMGARFLTVVAVVGIGSVATGVILFARSAQGRSTRVYTRQGFGGYTSLPAASSKPAPVDPLEAIKVAYRAGQWTEVEAQAAQIWQKGQFSSDNALRKQAAEAELLAGYAAAWRKDYMTAGERFRATQALAGELPDHGAHPAKLGEVQPTIEEEASFQHAVCTGARGDKQAAEQEYDDFMRQYPQSILVHAAVKRITRLHNGDIPDSADALWKQAMHQQKVYDDRKRREESMCGPECLAELLRRQGRTADIHALADAMQTGPEGTTLEQLARVAKQQGFTPQGLELTQKGLAQQSLPLIALLAPGHYVLVQAVNADSVTIWDPNGNGVGHGSERTLKLSEWQRDWTGMALSIK